MESIGPEKSGQNAAVSATAITVLKQQEEERQPHDWTTEFFQELFPSLDDCFN